MEKSIKLLIAGLLVSSISAAQVTDSIQQYGRGISYQLKESTTAGAVVTSEALEHRTSTVSSNALFGLIPGLQVLQQPGNEWENGAKLLVRGVGTSNSTEPLILVDGFERSIENLAVRDIESVTVLKDAASLALYGVRGANGVIYIKTKRGHLGKPVITFDYEFKMGTPTYKPKFVDGYTYAQAVNEGMQNDGLAPRYSQRELEAFQNQTYPEFYPNVNWWDEAIRKHSFGNQANFSMSGGGEIAQYYAQLNYLNDKGILAPTDWNDGYSTQFKYSKLNFLTNLDVKLGNSTKLQLGVRGDFSESNRPFTTTENIFSSLYHVPAGAMPIKTSHGMWGATTVYGVNPIAAIAGSGYERAQSRNLYADMKLTQNLDFITPGLMAAVRIGFDNEAVYWERNERKYATEMVHKGWDGAPDTYTKLQEEGALSFSSSIKDVVCRFNFNAEVNYGKKWGDHTLDAVLFYGMDKLTRRGQNKGRAFMDVAGQAHYTYKGRYLLDLAVSASASSVLDPDDRWGFFPSVGAGWILSEEDAFKTDWLDLLKVRASFGLAGRADFGVNLYRDAYGSGGKYFFGNDKPNSLSGMKETRLAVDGLTYEKSHKLNVGFDFQAWKHLSVNVDAYYDHRTDILVSGAGKLSSVLGLDAPDVNDGVINSYGVELAAQWQDKIGEVNYHVGGNFSFNRNEIKEMNEVYRPYDYQKRTGQSVGQLFGYEVEGIYQSQQEIDEREVKQYLSEVVPGDLKFKDQNGDNRIDEYDQVALGHSNLCPEIYYGLNLGAEYKGLGFMALFQGVGNYSTILDTKSVYRPLTGNNTISQHYYDNRWTPSNPSGKYPRLTTTSSKNNYNNNSLWIADASYFKLRTLEVFYHVPQKWMDKVPGVEHARFFVRGHDLFSINQLAGVCDPEAVGAVHPLMRQYTFGVNLRF